jgi:hypothetical protein
LKNGEGGTKGGADDEVLVEVRTLKIEGLTHP